MAIKWKVIVSVVVLVLLAVFLIINQSGKKSQELTVPGSAEEEATIEQPITPPAATGNIDDAVDALFSDSSDEITQTGKAIDDDTALLDFDSQAISDFGQSYNENDF